MRTDGQREMKNQRVVGQTKAAGFQIGVRRTFPLSLQDAWQLLTSEKGLHIWLGTSSPLQLVKGEAYTTEDGVTGEIRVVNEMENIRLTWHPPAWQHASTVQIRTIPNGDNTVISFHQENLTGTRDREKMKQHWQEVLDKLKEM